MAMHCSCIVHFLSVFNRPTSTLSDISKILWMSHKTIFVGYIWTVANTFKRYFWDASEKSQNRYLFWECSRHLTEKNIFFEIHLRRVKDVTKKISFLRCIWDVLKTSQKRYLLWDVSERSLRCLSQWRSDWAPSKKSHAGWESIS